eukprot:TRINITY_DN6250_c0_g1_i1.p1 TRINITY_DN6250_c0_g1~~TRINITY_DN6250_c0_g1_i1.p1  ORF type:complete len:543 (-),score=89.63 TRINITY_DN6250_c0_g1_i1:283-1911(-)
MVTIGALLVDLVLMMIIDHLIGLCLEGKQAWQPCARSLELRNPSIPTRARRQRWLLDSFAYLMVMWLMNRSMIGFGLGAMASFHRSATASIGEKELEHRTVARAIWIVVNTMVWRMEWEAGLANMRKIWTIPRNLQPYAQFGVNRWFGQTQVQWTLEQLGAKVEQVCLPEQPSAEVQEAMAGELAEAAGLEREAASGLLSIFHWNSSGLLQGATDGRLARILQLHHEHPDTMIGVLASELYSGALQHRVKGSELAKLACNRSAPSHHQASNGKSQTEWQDSVPKEFDWRESWVGGTHDPERHPGWVLQLVEANPLGRRHDRDAESQLPGAASCLESMLLAQWTWLNWKQGGQELDLSARAELRKAVQHATRVAGECAGFTDLAKVLKGKCIGRRDCPELLCAEFGLVQTAWRQRYGFDAPEPSTVSFSHFLKQWLFNHGPLIASIDGTQAIQHYHAGVLVDEATTVTRRNLYVLVIGYQDHSNGSGHWICRPNPNWGNSFGEDGCIRIQYGALGVNQAMGFMICRRQSTSADGLTGYWQTPS